MKADQLNGLFVKLKAACAKEPTQAAEDVLKESIIDNRLTDEEIIRAYRASRDAESPWWPKPGEFLARARPPATVALVKSEADTILTLILDNPLKYGTYSPEVGTVYERRKIEAQHGRAAGEAFGAIQSRIATMETLADRKWLSITFCEAYEAAREAYGAPVALTPPSRQIASQRAAGELTGVTQEDAKAEEARLAFVAAIRGPLPPAPTVDFAARKVELEKQAAALLAESQDSPAETRLRATA